jgi:hypothetical protein
VHYIEFGVGYENSIQAKLGNFAESVLTGVPANQNISDLLFKGLDPTQVIMKHIEIMFDAAFKRIQEETLSYIVSLKEKAFREIGFEGLYNNFLATIQFSVKQLEDLDAFATKVAPNFTRKLEIIKQLQGKINDMAGTAISATGYVKTGLDYSIDLIAKTSDIFNKQDQYITKFNVIIKKFINFDVKAELNKVRQYIEVIDDYIIYLFDKVTKAIEDKITQGYNAGWNKVLEFDFDIPNIFELIQAWVGDAAADVQEKFRGMADAGVGTLLENFKKAGEEAKV